MTDSDLIAFQNVVVPDETQLQNVPEEMLDSTYQHAIIDFKAVMQTLQKTIAIEHAKKVRGNLWVMIRNSCLLLETVVIIYVYQF